jgi:PAS domain-containing protein
MESAGGAQKAIEVILARQLASYLAMPIFLVDAVGTLVYYNEPAERILGQRFDETGEMLAAEWATAFAPTDDAGRPLAPESVPLMIAHVERRPAHANLWIRGLDHVARRIEATALPLVGSGDRYVGALVAFWETPAA